MMKLILPFQMCHWRWVLHVVIRNSSEDEIANVNILYDNIVYALQNTIDSGINSARDRCGYVLERRFTKVIEITQCNGHYAVQGHSRSPIFGNNRKLIYDFLLVINTNLPPTSYLLPSYGWLLVTIFASERRVPHINALSRFAGVIPCQYRHKSLKSRFFGLHFRCRNLILLHTWPQGI